MEEADVVQQYLQEQAMRFQKFTGVQESSPNAIFILVMGMTGSGKSSFIASCTGKGAVGHGLESCTSDIEMFDFELDGHQVFLIDTPGFNDTYKSDAETLATISAYLGTSYAQNVFVHGILYLHRISDNRVSGSAKRNFEIFRTLCGEVAFENVGLVTTMWSDAGRQVQLRREAELGQDADFFGSIIAGGASLFRHGERGSDSQQSRASALAILRQLIVQCPGPIVLLVQHELVDEDKALRDTSAGRLVSGHMHRASAEHRRELAALKEERKNAQGHMSPQDKAEMADLQAEVERKLGAGENGRKVLQSDLAKLQERERRVLMARMTTIEQKFRAELDQREANLQKLEMSVRQALPQPGIQSKLDKQITHARQRVQKSRQANARLKATTSGVKEGMMVGFSTSVSSALATGAVTALAGLLVCTIM